MEEDELKGDSFLSLSHLAVSPLLLQCFSTQLGFPRRGLTCTPGEEEEEENSPAPPYSAAFAAGGGSRDISDPTGTEWMGKGGILWLSAALLVLPLKPFPKD